MYTSHPRPRAPEAGHPHPRERPASRSPARPAPPPRSLAQRRARAQVSLVWPEFLRLALDH